MKFKPSVCFKCGLLYSHFRLDGDDFHPLCEQCLEDSMEMQSEGRNSNVHFGEMRQAVEWAYQNVKDLIVSFVGEYKKVDELRVRFQ